MALTRTTDPLAAEWGRFASKTRPELDVQYGAPIFAVTSTSENMVRAQDILESMTRIIGPDETEDPLLEIIRSLTLCQTKIRDFKNQGRPSKCPKPVSFISRFDFLSFQHPILEPVLRQQLDQLINIDRLEQVVVEARLPGALDRLFFSIA